MQLHFNSQVFLLPLLVSGMVVLISGPVNGHKVPLALDCGGDEEISVECPPQSGHEPVYLPYPNDCKKYIICSNGESVIQCCSPPLLWDQELKVCNHPGVTPCEISSTVQTTSQPITTMPTTVIPTTTPASTTTMSTTNEPTTEPSTTEPTSEPTSETTTEPTSEPTSEPTTPSEPTTWLSSQRITEFGSWGSMTTCPGGTFAQGFQLQTETDTGSSDDDTALNTVRLFCGDPSDPSTKSITGKEGFWGDWGEVYTCQKDGVLGYITSFYLRSESDQGPSGDNTAANNFRAICRYSDGSSEEIEGDGLSSGSWYKAYGDCGFSGAICGMTTQVLNRQGADGDDSTLNNVDAECCDL